MMLSLRASLHADLVSCVKTWQEGVHVLGNRVDHRERTIGDYSALFNTLVESHKQSRHTMHSRNSLPGFQLSQVLTQRLSIQLPGMCSGKEKRKPPGHPQLSCLPSQGFLFGPKGLIRHCYMWDQLTTKYTGGCVCTKLTPNSVLLCPVQVHSIGHIWTPFDMWWL